MMMTMMMSTSFCSPFLCCVLGLCRCGWAIHCVIFRGLVCSTALSISLTAVVPNDIGFPVHEYKSSYYDLMKNRVLARRQELSYGSKHMVQVKQDSLDEDDG